MLDQFYILTHEHLFHYSLIGFIGAGACLIVTGFTSCEHRYMAVAFLSLAVMFTGFSQAGYICNHVDFAPK